MFLPPETKPRVMAMFDNFVASFKRRHRATGLDGSGNQEGSPGQAGRAETEDRLPGQMARLQRMKTQPADLIANARRAVWSRQQNLTSWASRSTATNGR
jgi:hypothetical protein